MKLHQFVIGISTCLLLVAGAQAQTPQQTILDWRFSSFANPSAPTGPNTVNPSGAAATATITGSNTEYFFGAGPLGLYGTLTGLWAIERGGAALPELDLVLHQTPLTNVNLRLDITHFIDNSQFPGIVAFDIAGWTAGTRQVVQQQTGDMIGYWAKDTYTWSGVTFANQQPIALSLFPGGASGGLLLDAIEFGIVGTVVVPEPSSLTLAGLGLALLGLRSWSRNRRA